MGKVHLCISTLFWFNSPCYINLHYITVLLFLFFVNLISVLGGKKTSYIGNMGCCT
uniref:Uncharacterized protein n=1 Tax=Anguilla anguilla TaxID=7936 RepID=A0A0E9V891_ANGAN